MHKVIAIFILIIVFIGGVFIWKYEGRADKDALDLKIKAHANGSVVTLVWSGANLKKESITEIYQSDNEALEGEKIGEILESLPQVFVADKLLSNHRYFFTLKSRTGVDDREFLGRESVVTEKYPSDIIILSKNEQKVPVIKIFNTDGVLLNEFAPLDLRYRGEVDLARIDLNSDYMDELIVFPKGPHAFIKLFDSKGQLINQLAPYGEKFKRGFSVTALNLDKEPGGSGYFAVASLWASDSSQNEKYPVKLFKVEDEGKKITLVDEFIEYENFNGGVQLFTADTNGDGREELITSPIEGAAEIRVHQFCQTDVGDCVKFYGESKLTKPFSVYDKIFPYGKTEFQDIDLYSYDVDQDGKQELIIYPEKGRMSLIKVYSCEVLEGYRCLYKELDSFQAYHDKYTGGVNVSAFTLGSDRCLVVTPREGGGPHLKTYCYVSDKFVLKNESYVYAQDFDGGALTTTVSMQNIGNVIVTVPQSRAGSHIRIFDPESLNLIKDFFAFDKELRGSYLVR